MAGFRVVHHRRRTLPDDRYPLRVSFCWKESVDGAPFVGISTTRMRYVELRNPHLKGDDRPNFVPSAILAKPEERETGLNDIQHPDTMTTDDRAAQVVLAPPVKKRRSKKRASLESNRG